MALPPRIYDLRAFLYEIVLTRPYENRVLQDREEGWPNFDGRGFTCLFAQGLLAAGASISDMRGLAVKVPDHPGHMVLQYQDKVLDNLKAELAVPSDYTVTQTLSQAELSALMAKLGLK